MAYLHFFNLVFITYLILLLFFLSIIIPAQDTKSTHQLQNTQSSQIKKSKDFSNKSQKYIKQQKCDVAQVQNIYKSPYVQNPVMIPPMISSSGQQISINLMDQENTQREQRHKKPYMDQISQESHKKKAIVTLNLKEIFNDEKIKSSLPNSYGKIPDHQTNSFLNIKKDKIDFPGQIPYEKGDNKQKQRDAQIQKHMGKISNGSEGSRAVSNSFQYNTRKSKGSRVIDDFKSNVVVKGDSIRSSSELSFKSLTIFGKKGVKNQPDDQFSQKSVKSVIEPQLRSGGRYLQRLRKIQSDLGDVIPTERLRSQSNALRLAQMKGNGQLHINTHLPKHQISLSNHQINLQERNYRSNSSKIDSLKQQHKIDKKKKREMKLLKKDLEDLEKYDEEYMPRRSHRQMLSGDGHNSIYTLDKMRIGAFHNSVIEKERRIQEERMVQYTIQISLLNETKHKKKKDVIREPKQWFKNFLNEQEQSLSLDIPPILKEEINGQQSQSKTKHNSPVKQSIEKEPKKPSVEKPKEIISKKQQHKNDELQDLIDSSIKNKNNHEDDDDDFLEPIPITKKKSITKLDILKKSKEKSELTNQYHPQIVNAMDQNLRDDFTKPLKFVDFRDQNTENALYKPAIIQKNQQENKYQQSDPDYITGIQQKNDETDSYSCSGTINCSQINLSSAATAPSSEMNSQISLNQHIISKDMSKGHFIKKKQQSQCNVKRQCGVSYIKQSESEQLDVLDKGYQKLPPIAIQGSYTLTKPNSDQLAKLQPKIKQLIDNLFFNGSGDKYLILTTFESNNEIEMKNYLLHPSQRLQICHGKYWLIRKGNQNESILDQLWTFIKDKHFVCIHFVYDQNCLIQTVDLNSHLKSLFKNNKNQNSVTELTDSLKVIAEHFIKQSDICMGILPKRGNASVKSMLKVYKLEEYYDQHMIHSMSKKEDQQQLNKLINCDGAIINGINTMAYLTRLELYVNEHKWINATMYQKQALTAFINTLEDNMSNVLLTWNKRRTEIYSDHHPKTYLNHITYLHFSSQEIQAFSKFKNYQSESNEQIWKPLVKDFGIQIKDKSFEQCSEMIELNIQDPIDVKSILKKTIPTPVTLINTRDCFAYDLKWIDDVIKRPGKPDIIKRDFYFDPSIDGGYPDNFKSVVGLDKNANMKDINNLKVGVSGYIGVFSNEEMNEMENAIEETEKKSLEDGFLPMTAQKTYTGQNLKRTKFFFGYRYIWTKSQLQDPLANVAAGVRADVSRAPVWTKTKMVEPLEKIGILEKNFINSIALNVYHDGSEGLAQHFDDATRFKQPIYTFRLFSDSRLSFGSQYYGFQNGAFTVPLPRGAVCVMEEGSYAANGIKHCVRPCDMTGKSAAIIFRQMHHNVTKEAEKLDRNIDLPMWLSTLSLNEKAIPFYQQKEMECNWLEKQIVGAGGCSQNKKDQFSITKLNKLQQQHSNQSGELDKCTPNFGKSQKEQEEKHRKKIIQQVMDDVVARIEVKDQEEQEIIMKINSLRQQFKPNQQQDQYEALPLFETRKVNKDYLISLDNL